MIHRQRLHAIARSTRSLARVHYSFSYLRYKSVQEWRQLAKSTSGHGKHRQRILPSPLSLLKLLYTYFTSRSHFSIPQRLTDLLTRSFTRYPVYSRLSVWLGYSLACTPSIVGSNSVALMGSLEWSWRHDLPHAITSISFVYRYSSLHHYSCMHSSLKDWRKL